MRNQTNPCPTHNYIKANEVCDEALKSIRAGSLTWMKDVLMLPINTTLIGQVADKATGSGEKKREIQQRTGQTGAWDRTKWFFFPATQLEKTQNLIAEDIEKESVKLEAKLALVA